MANLLSNAVSRKLPVPGFGAGGGQIREQFSSVAIPIGTTTTDTIQLFDLPPNARVVGLRVKNDALGAGTLNVGDGGYGSVAADADRYLAAQAVTSAGYTTTLLATGANFRTGPRKLRITAGFAAGTTSTAGNVEAAIQFVVEEPQA